jgi:hypothetical protein
MSARSNVDSIATLKVVAALRLLLAIHVASVAHTLCGLQRQHGSPITIYTIQSPFHN